MTPRQHPLQLGHVVVVSFHKFIDRLNRSGLLTTSELQALLAAAPQEERPGDVQALARWLVKRGHLTPFQAKAIYVGQTKGLIVGNYVILDLLGVGGMGQVYKARHLRMKRTVAIKLLSADVAKNPQLVQRFHQEVEAAARLMHSNIVTAFDADEADGKHFLVMEYVPGRDLASIVKERGRLSVDRSIRCVLDAARGLEYAHKRGIVHRDVKPSNLLLASSDADSALSDEPSTRVKILDMGLARVEQEAESLNAPSDLTGTGIVMGTVDYMSPEQAVNTHEADHRSDIYSLGVTLFYLVTGTVPFTGRTVIEQILAHREGEIPSLQQARREVPPALDAIFQRMVAKRPEDRYQSMSGVVADLESVLSGNESTTDLAAAASENDDDALTNFLDSMSGDAATKRQATAAVITPSSTHEPESDTLVGSQRSTTIESLARLRRRKERAIPWGSVLLHSTWSITLLGFAIWLLVSSREPDVLEGADALTAKPVSTGESTPVGGDGATAGVADLDRRLAAWVLSKGGSLMVAEATRSELVLPGQDLPPWTFVVTAINLPGAVVAANDMQQLAEFSRLPMLRTLVLAGSSQVDNGWIASLEPLDRLDQLDLRGTSVTDAGLPALAQACPMLEVLELGGCAIDGSGLNAWSDQPMLRQLGLRDTPLTAAALPFLTAMPSLRQLDVRRTSLTAQQVQQLRDALPDCRVVADEGEETQP